MRSTADFDILTVPSRGTSLVLAFVNDQRPWKVIVHFEQSVAGWPIRQSGSMGDVSSRRFLFQCGVSKERVDVGTQHVRRASYATPTRSFATCAGKVRVLCILHMHVFLLKLVHSVKRACITTVCLHGTILLRSFHISCQSPLSVCFRTNNFSAFTGTSRLPCPRFQVMHVCYMPCCLIMSRLRV